MGTTPEQTVLDLAQLPALGDSEIEIPVAVAPLYERSDKDLLRTLATKQRRLAPWNVPRPGTDNEHRRTRRGGTAVRDCDGASRAGTTLGLIRAQAWRYVKALKRPASCHCVARQSPAPATKRRIAIPRE